MRRWGIGIGIILGLVGLAIMLPQAVGGETACPARAPVRFRVAGGSPAHQVPFAPGPGGVAPARVEVQDASNATVIVAPDHRSAAVVALVASAPVDVTFQVVDACAPARLASFEAQGQTRPCRPAPDCRRRTATPIAPTSTPLPTGTGSPTALPSSPTRTLVPTQTATPLPMTPVSTSVPTTTPTSVPMIEGVPLCTDHDPTKWHPLVQKDAAGNILCTYGHEHGDNPHDLDGLFGAPPVQDIDYPWHGVGRNGNPESHQAFKWEVFQPGTWGCQSANGNPFGFDAYRFEHHHSVISGDIVRFHSYMLQARTCDPADPSYHGMIQMGGWIDYGFLHQDGGGGDSNPAGSPCAEQVVSTTLAPGAPEPDPEVYNNGARRLHGIPGCERYDATWYGQQACYDSTCDMTLPRGPQFGDALRGGDWGSFDDSTPPTSLPTIIFFDDAHQSHHSWQQVGDVLALAVPAYTYGLQNGVLTGAWFTDRYGRIASGCTAAGLDCVPLIASNVKQGNYQLNGDSPPGFSLIRDNDVKSPVTGNSLITFPN